MTMTFRCFLNALLLIAASALPTWASAQNSFMTKGATGAVVTTDQVRAELLAWAPEGVTPGKPVWVGLQLAHVP